MVVMMGVMTLVPWQTWRNCLLNYFEIYETSEFYGATCALYIIDKRVYPPNHPHYVDPEVYKKIMNSVNKMLFKKN